MVQKVNKWLEADNNIKEQIRAGFLQALLSPVTIVSHTAAQILAAYGAVDVTRNAWPVLLPSLLNNVANEAVGVRPKVSSLEALGYMCDAMDPEDVEPAVVAQILSAIIDGMRAIRPVEVRLAGVTALCNSLDFTEVNFDNDTERDMIMTTVCEATQCADMKVRTKAFECLARVADLYYNKLQSYVETIFSLTTTAIRTDDQAVGLQAIEFWTTVCDCEASILEDIEEGVTTNPPQVYLKLVGQAAPTLVPIMLETLTKQQEDADADDDWNISMAGATCLEAMALTIKDSIVQTVLPFVQQNITSTQWRQKEAAIMAFCCILDGPSPKDLRPIVHQALPVLITCLKDANQMVRETAAYTIAKICEQHKDSITGDMLTPMVEGLCIALQDSSPKTCAQVCYALHNFAGACAEEADKPTNVLSPFMPVLLDKLLTATVRADWEEENIRAAAYEAVNMMVANSAFDRRSVVSSLLAEALNRLELTFSAQFNPAERMGLQSLLCSLVGECVQKLTTEEIAPMADRIMTFLLQVFNTKGAVAHEDAFLSIGFMADKLGEHLSRYMQALQPAIIMGLKNFEEYQVCTVCVGVVGDVCRSLKHGVMAHCDEIMRCLLELLQSPSINRSVKPYVISLFADIAMAVEGDFDRYTSIVLGILKQAGEVNISPDADEDLVEYINSLRVAIMEAYTGIIQGLKEAGKDAGKQDLILPALDTIRDLLQRSSMDDHKSEECLKVAVGLLGDLGQTFGVRIQPLYQQPFVAKVVAEGMECEDLQGTCKWAQDIIRKVLRGQNPSQ